MNFLKILDPDALLRMTFCCIIFSTFAKQSLNFEIFFQQFKDRFTHELNHNDKASGFITLLLLEKIAPQFFKKKKLQNKLDQRFNCIEQIIMPANLECQNLQGYLDYWYFSKLLGKKEFFVPRFYVKRIFDVAKIKKLSPEEALLTWIYFEIICFCNLISSYKKEREQKKLERVVLQNKEMEGYLLTHIILYDTAFGQKKATQRSWKALKLLQTYCNNYSPEKISLDLVGEIIICYKLLKQKQSRWCKKGIILLQAQNKINSFHQLCVSIVAVADI